MPKKQHKYILGLFSLLLVGCFFISNTPVLAVGPAMPIPVIKNYCTNHTQCKPTEFCTTPTSLMGRNCAPKKPIGEKCMDPVGNIQCQSGKCEQVGSDKLCVKSPTEQNTLNFEPVAPKLEIEIPTLQPFTTKDIKPDSSGYVNIPFLGQYMVAIFRWALLVAGVIALALVIFGGFIYLTSGGNAQRTQLGKDRIKQALLGLLLLLSSYTILYIINPDLVKFRSLKIKILERINLEDPNEGKDEAAGYSITPGTLGPKNSRTFTPKNISDFTFPVTDGFVVNRFNWGQARFDDAKKLYLKCHSGFDIYTDWKNMKGTVVSMTAGTFKSVSNGFTKCSQGKSANSPSGAEDSVGAVYIFDDINQATYVYGEINNDSILVKTGDKVIKGQKLGIATKCQMLHLEIYKGYPPKKGKEGGWFSDTNLPVRPQACVEKGLIATLDNVGSTLMDPSQLLYDLKNNTGSNPNPSSASPTTLGCCTYFDGSTQQDNITEEDCLSNNLNNNWVGLSCLTP